MYPGVPVPPGSGVVTPIDVALKRGWRYLPQTVEFVGPRETRFRPKGLPKGTRIVFKVPEFATANPKHLSRPQRELARYLQVILPPKLSPAGALELVRDWPCAEHAALAPAVSLPGTRS